MPGYIFLSDSITHPVFLHRHTIGVPERLYPQYAAVLPGDLLFLYHTNQHALYGPYLAATACTRRPHSLCFADLPERFRFPLHIKFSARGTLPKPLPKEQARLITFNPAGNPQRQVDDATALKLARYIQNHNRQPWEPDNLDNRDIANHFILACNNATIPYIFGKNLFGITKRDYDHELYKIREGSLLFAWHSTEHRLFGVWRAAERADFNPVLFNGIAPEAPLLFTLQATRYVTTHLSAQSNWLEATLHIGGQLQLTLNYNNGRRLLEYFRGTADLTPYMPGPKPFVFSNGYTRANHTAHALIADWLEHHGIAYGYHKPVTYGGRSAFYPDFYLPDYDVYIEYLNQHSQPNNPNYIATKQKMFTQLGLHCIYLFPRDLEIVGGVLQRRLTALLQCAS